MVPSLQPETPRFGPLLKSLRLAAGLSQEDLAGRSGLSVRGISDLERGARTQPRMETIRMLADALDLSETDRSALITAARPDDLLSAAPPATTKSVLRLPNLPIPPTAIVGRDAEIDQLIDLLTVKRARLVTVTGQGGIGKSRLCLEVAAILRDHQNLPATFIDLSPVREASLVPTVVATRLDARPTGSETPTDALITTIGDHRVLLVLDNWEHVIEAATLVSDLLANCAGVTILATSRERLRLRGEQEVRLSSLSIDPALVASDGESGASPALQLFVERLRDTHPGFHLGPDTIDDANAICRRLEGLPLAIELAAARAEALPLGELRRQLDDRLTLLADGPRDLPDRHQTMQRTIAWSFDLLEPTEQEIFLRVSVFSGGFDPEIGCDVAAVDRAVGNRLFIALSEKNLLNASRSSEQFRYTIPETIREPALEWLQARGWLADTASRHAEAFVDMAIASETELTGPDPMPVFHRLETDIDNFRTAARWLLEHHQAEQVGQMIASLAWFWTEPRFLREGRDWFDQVLAAGDALSPGLRAKSLAAAGDLAQWHLDVDVADRYHRQALDIWRELGDQTQVLTALRGMGSAALERGDFAAGEAMLLEVCELARSADQQWDLAAATNLLGLSASFQGHNDQAIRLHTVAKDLWQKLGDQNHVATAMGSLAWASLRCGRFDDAAEACRQTIDLASASEDQLLVLWGITGVGMLRWYRDHDAAQAVELLAAAEHRRHLLGTPVWGPIRTILEELDAELRSALSPEIYDQAFTAGRELTVPAMSERARTLLTGS